MKIKKEYKVREVAGEYMAVCQGKNLQDMTKVISLNQSAAELWKSLEGKSFTLDDAAQQLQELYGIDDQRAKADAAKWIDSLVNANVIE